MDQGLLEAAKFTYDYNKVYSSYLARVLKQLDYRPVSFLGSIAQWCPAEVIS
jgi:hypothetical protein